MITNCIPLQSPPLVHRNTLASLSPLNFALFHSATREAVLASLLPQLFKKFISDNRPWVFQVPEKIFKAFWLLFFSWLQMRAKCFHHSYQEVGKAYTAHWQLQRNSPSKSFLPFPMNFLFLIWLRDNKWANADGRNFLSLSMSYVSYSRTLP